MSQKNILVPELPESIHHATIVNWHKNIGDYVTQDEILVEIETEKVILEIPSITNGTLINILYKSGTIVHSKQIIGQIQEKNINNIPEKTIITDKKKDINHTLKNTNNNTQYSSPSIRRNIFKNNIKKNIINTNQKNKNTNKSINNLSYKNDNHSLEKRIPMNFIRKKTAEKLLHTVQNTAMLTTFNEVNMHSILEIRKKYSVSFEKRYNVKLGLTSFFIKAAVESLKNFPEINSKIDKNDIIYYKYYNINVAISTKYGLIAPVLKNVNNMSISTIEKKIQYFLLKGNLGKLKLEDLIGGNFTITNGGVFGSLLSTPMINFPQTAILGIHKIQNRAIVINNEIKISPMMYIALSYDHRLIDGKEAIGFLKYVKNVLEEPSRILLEI